MTDPVTTIYQDIDLSLTESGPPVVIQVKQYDHMSRKLRCSLYGNGKEYHIPEEIIVSYSGVRPDGKLFQYSTDAINNDKIWLTENKLILTITDFMTEVPGRFPVDVMFMENTGAALCAFPFVLYIEKSAVPEKSVLKATYADILESILNGLTGCFITDDGHFGIASEDGVNFREGDYSDVLERVKSSMVECSVDNDGNIVFQTDGLFGLSYDIDEQGRLIVYYLEE